MEYYLHVDTSHLSDKEWAQKYAQLLDIMQRENGN
jgi:hypothetical protein